MLHTCVKQASQKKSQRHFFFHYFSFSLYVSILRINNLKSIKAVIVLQAQCTRTVYPYVENSEKIGVPHTCVKYLKNVDLPCRVLFLSLFVHLFPTLKTNPFPSGGFVGFVSADLHSLKTIIYKSRRCGSKIIQFLCKTSRSYQSLDFFFPQTFWRL